MSDASPGLPVERLRHTREFDAALRRGRRARGRLVSVAASLNDRSHSRRGLAVSRRVGGAVVRNRVKRRLREIVRALPVRGGRDLVLTALPEAATATFAELRADVAAVLDRVGALEGGGATA